MKLKVLSKTVEACDLCRREQDAWIEINIFGHLDLYGFKIMDGRKVCGVDYSWQGKIIPHYTTDPAAAMQVLKKCAEKCVVTIEADSGMWLVARLSKSNGGHQEDFCKVSDTLPLAIALFAKQLFSK